MCRHGWAGGHKGAPQVSTLSLGVRAELAGALRRIRNRLRGGYPGGRCGGGEGPAQAARLRRSRMVGSTTVVSG